ncbi:hypothetical protein CMV_020413 [Castanea mollissima]|uniref:Uncharacterized protein n=1 Tax=Castanea mollissima TaxID=60419 RepID=A0A8J4QW04_9ROSI|nr:hypothetical protein CMV_020413 [Castanea mollissima]
MLLTFHQEICKQSAILGSCAAFNITYKVLLKIFWLTHLSFLCTWNCIRNGEDHHLVSQSNSKTCVYWLAKGSQQIAYKRLNVLCRDYSEYMSLILQDIEEIREMMAQSSNSSCILLRK